MNVGKIVFAPVHDVNALDELCVEIGAIYLIYKGYVTSTGSSMSSTRMAHSL